MKIEIVFGLTELAERKRVVAITLEWIGTPYVHEGRIKQACADCTFFAKVFEEAGLIPPVEIPHYSPQAHINRGSSIYLGLVARYAKREITQAEVQIADVVMFNIGRTFSHGAIVVEPGWPTIVHADLPLGKVHLDTAHNGRLNGCERRFFSFW